uniref:BRCT domain-containing protein n=1 Tax=Heterorhabditis bacteriophora TaxID=37862 RepID=A0A1I7XBW1_HETBA
MTSPYFLIFGTQVPKAPEAVQHLSAERFRSVQKYPTLLPKERQTAIFGGQLLHSYPRDELGKRKEKDMEKASGEQSGTDPVPLFALHMTYTTRPP